MWLLRLCFKDSVFFKSDKSFPLHPGCCLLAKKYYLPLSTEMSSHFVCSCILLAIHIENSVQDTK